FIAELRACAMAAHDTVRAEAVTRSDARSMATTLSLAVVAWPWMYILQLGDSRCYFYEDGALRQVTRDQTMAQDLVDDGVLQRETAQKSPLAHVLSSAIGASTAAPAVTRVDVRKRGCVVLVCTDGLTKHVTDAELATHLGAMESAEQVCGALLALALERGGTDNITIVVGRAREDKKT
ncbi:MAG: protein phosphatase 2C domain-containing protein, partial [Gemmatimonadota bacterium]|nr:protein phosphatase 2C domain-containing protein [Gemmatimonadota bacterium]